MFVTFLKQLAVALYIACAVIVAILAFVFPYIWAKTRVREPEAKFEAAFPNASADGRLKCPAFWGLRHDRSKG